MSMIHSSEPIPHGPWDVVVIGAGAAGPLASGNGVGAHEQSAAVGSEYTQHKRTAGGDSGAKRVKKVKSRARRKKKRK